MPSLLIILGVAAVVLLLVGGAVLVQGYKGGKPFDLRVKPIGGGLFLETNAAEAWLRMQSAAAAAGLALGPSGSSSAWRSQAQQAALLESLGKYGEGGYAASAGYSPHQQGKAIDVANVSAGTSTYDARLSAWLDENSQRFGWYRVGKNFSTPEPWHFEYRASGVA